HDVQGEAPDMHGDHESHEGHSSHDTHDVHASDDMRDAHDGHDSHGAHGHGPDTSDVPTLVPTTWRQLVLPALILLLVIILIAGPVMNAFAYRPATGPDTEQTEQEGEGSVPPTSVTTVAQVQNTATIALAPTRTTAPTRAATATKSAPTATLSPGDRLSPTQTAVAEAGQNGIVARVPVELNFAGTTFVVRAGDTLLPDWEPSTDPGIATWIEGTVANHVLYVPFSDENLALFTAAKPGDMLTMTMNTGQVFEFEVNRAERVANGPPTEEGQFTVTTAMSQDHAGVTLFLIGDPAPDRAVLQAEFTGNIQ
ncbi:MAG: hypothetical protein M3328_15690, partial [Chloroflexota bacterium]|nr:hypothetical protein [Chloroflexota bacterium]